MLYLELGLGRNVNNTTEFEKNKETEKEKNVEKEKEKKKENLLSYCQKLAKIPTDPRCVIEKQIATNSIVIKKSPVFFTKQSQKRKKKHRITIS